MSTTELTCDWCGKKFRKENKELNRRKRQGHSKFYCDKSCGRSAANKTRYANGYQNPEVCNLNLKKGSETDEYTKFRWYMKRIKDRAKDCDIDLQYIASIWENQNGKCPLTGWSLTLRTHSDKRQAEPNDASLDRIDSSKGYVKGNVRFIACIANMAKNKWSDEILISFCNAVTGENQCAEL